MDITKTRITKGRNSILPKYCGNHFINFEMAIYSLADQFIKEYSGGHWEFYSLSNGGFYMVFESDNPVTFDNPDNYFSKEMDSETASIIVNLYVYCLLSFKYENAPFGELYHQLRDYALDLPEAGVIAMAID